MQQNEAEVSFSERLVHTSALVCPPSGSGKRSAKPWSGTPSGYEKIVSPSMEALERQADSLISTLKPDEASICLRQNVFRFVEKLITDCFSEIPIKVNLFGSVPIRTYLPHGDIDCTFQLAQSEQAQELPNWANRLMKHIQQRTQSQSRPSPPNAVHRGALSSTSVVASSIPGQMFPIQKVEVIPAEVTLVKCNLEVPTSHNNSMVVDISFNQRGGVNAADFLEAVDRYVDAYQAVQMGTTDGATGAALVDRWEKDPDAQRPNLLKRGIILVKAWCYYEARVLGAHHSLLSSYALEVMVLYVLQHYHRRTRTPFALLVTYLQVFSAFDWSTYGLTLHGPIPLTQIATTPPGDGSTAASRASAAPDACSEPLIPLPALSELLAQFAMPPRMSMGRLRPMNILDPLQELNNLGRSVSKASHQRIVFVMKHCTGIIDRVMKNVERDYTVAEREFKDLFKHPFLTGRSPTSHPAMQPHMSPGFLTNSPRTALAPPHAQPSGRDKPPQEVYVNPQASHSWNVMHLSGPGGQAATPAGPHQVVPHRISSGLSGQLMPAAAVSTSAAPGHGGRSSPRTGSASAHSQAGTQHPESAASTPQANPEAATAAHQYQQTVPVPDHMNKPQGAPTSNSDHHASITSGVRMVAQTPQGQVRYIMYTSAPPTYTLGGNSHRTGAGVIHESHAGIPEGAHDPQRLLSHDGVTFLPSTAQVAPGMGAQAVAHKAVGQKPGSHDQQQQHSQQLQPGASGDSAAQAQQVEAVSMERAGSGSHQWPVSGVNLIPVHSNALAGVPVALAGPGEPLSTYAAAAAAEAANERSAGTPSHSQRDDSQISDGGHGDASKAARARAASSGHVPSEDSLTACSTQRRRSNPQLPGPMPTRPAAGHHRSGSSDTRQCLTEYSGTSSATSADDVPPGSGQRHSKTNSAGAAAGVNTGTNPDSSIALSSAPEHTTAVHVLSPQGSFPNVSHVHPGDIQLVRGAYLPAQQYVELRSGGGTGAHHANFHPSVAATQGNPQNAPQPIYLAPSAGAEGLHGGVVRAGVSGGTPVMVSAGGVSAAHHLHMPLGAPGTGGAPTHATVYLPPHLHTAGHPHTHPVQQAVPGAAGGGGPASSMAPQAAHMLHSMSLVPVSQHQQLAHSLEGTPPSVYSLVHLPQSPQMFLEYAAAEASGRMRDSSQQDSADHPNGHGGSADGNNPQRQPPARNSSRHNSRPPSRVPSSNMLVAVPAAPPVQMAVQEPNLRPPASVGTGVSHAWLTTPSSDGHPHTHSDYSQQHGWTGSGQVSPHAGDTPESVFVDARAESLSSLDGTQNSGSLYTANSVLSVKQGASIDVVGGARPASGPLSAGSSGAPPPQASGSSSRMLPLHTVHSLNDNGMREYASERIENAATAMEIVSGALRQPGNAWAQGAPSILDFGPGGRSTVAGRAVSQGEGVTLTNGTAPVGVHLHSGMMHTTHAVHGEGFPARQVHGEAVQLARYPYVGQATDVMGSFGRGSDVGSPGPGGSGFGGNGGGQRSAPYHRNEGGHNMRRGGDHGGPQGSGGYGGGGGGGYGSGRGKQKFVGGRGNKMRSNSAGPYAGGGGRGGGGRDGGGGPHHHQHHQQRYPPSYSKSNHHSGHNTYMNNGAAGQHHHGGMHSSRHSVTSGHIGSDGRMDSQEHLRSDPDVDPRLKLDNAAQFPALEGGTASPRAAAAMAAAAHWPAKDRSTGPYSGASPPATQGSFSGPSAAAMSSSDDPAAIVAAAAIEAAVHTAASAAAGPAAVSATGASSSDHSQAQSGSLPASTSTQDTMLHPPTRAWSETGGGTGAWIGGGSGGRGSRHGAGSTSNATTPRAGPSSWSEVASSPATGTAAGRHNRNPSSGNTTGFAMEPIAPRAWHSGSGRVAGGYGGRSGGGRRPGGSGMHHSGGGGPHHSMPHRRGRSVDDDRNGNLEGIHSGSSARSDGKTPHPPRPVGMVNAREQ